MHARIWPASLPPPMASKARVAPVATSASVRSLHEARASSRRRRARADRAQQRRLLGLAHDVDQRRRRPARQMRLSIWPRFEAAAVCTSARVAFAPHRLDHAERGERVDEARGAVGRRRAVGQEQALLGRERSGTARTSRRRARRPSCPAAPAPRRTRPPRRRRRRLRCRPASTRRAGRPSPSSPPSGIARGDDRPLARARAPAVRHVGGAEQQAEVGRVDRRGLDAHQHFVRPGLGNRHLGERHFEFAARLDERAKLQCRVLRRGCSWTALPG